MENIKQRLNFTQHSLNIVLIYMSVCGGMLHIESMHNSYQILSLKVKFSKFNEINRHMDIKHCKKLEKKPR